MNEWLVSIVTAALALLAGYAAIALIDKRCIDGSKYMDNRYWFFIPIFIAIVGGALAFRAFTRTVSVYAFVALIITYLFVSMAGISDYKIKLIPNWAPLPIVIARIVIFIIEFIAGELEALYIISSIAGGLFCILLFYVAMKLTKGGVGYGDMKLMGAVGFGTGVYASFSSLILALFACTIFALLMVLFKRKKMSGELPFAPFIYIGFAGALALSLY